MSLKENIDYMKTELTAQEQFIENFVKAEKVFKKYKTLILGTFIGIVILIIAMFGYDYMDEQNKIKANLAFTEFLKDKNNEQALQTIKANNKNLYEIAMHIKDENHIPEVAIFKEIAMFQNAVKNGDTKTIDSLLSNNNFLFKDYAVVIKAIQAIKADDLKSAEQTIKMLPKDSMSSDLASLLEHYIATKSN
jgi:H+/gluconate symporter-like permease